MLALTVRLIVSLAIVVGLLMLLARMGQKRFAGRTGSPVRVVHRQALSRSASVSVVTVGSRVLVLGTTDQQVRLLTELDPEELEVAGLAEALDDSTDDDFDDDTFGSQDAADAEELLAGTFDESYEAVAARFDAAVPAARPVRRNTPRSTAAVTKTAKNTTKPVTTTGGAIAPQSQGRLAGSALSLSTWKQAFQVASSLGGRSR